MRSSAEANRGACSATVRGLERCLPSSLISPAPIVVRVGHQRTWHSPRGCQGLAAPASFQDRELLLLPSRARGPFHHIQTNSRMSLQPSHSGLGPSPPYAADCACSLLRLQEPSFSSLLPWVMLVGLPARWACHVLGLPSKRSVDAAVLHNSTDPRGKAPLLSPHTSAVLAPGSVCVLHVDL